MLRIGLHSRLLVLFVLLLVLSQVAFSQERISLTLKERLKRLDEKLQNLELLLSKHKISLETALKKSNELRIELAEVKLLLANSLTSLNLVEQDLTKSIAHSENLQMRLDGLSVILSEMKSNQILLVVAGAVGAVALWELGKWIFTLLFQ